MKDLAPMSSIYALSLEKHILAKHKDALDEEVEVE
jgi:hypothetical protein